MAYTSHRNPRIFPDPESFIPDRWINPTTDMKVAFRPFSTGPRNCIGIHLARVQVLLMICTLYSRYDLQLDNPVTEDMMVAADRGIMTAHAKTVVFNMQRRYT